MAVKDKVRQRIQDLLPPGELIRYVTVAQLKPGGGGRRIAANVALSTAVAAVTSVGMMRLSTPSPVYVAVTDLRIAAFIKPQMGSSVGELVIDFPRAAVQLSYTTGLLATVHFTDRATGQQIFRLNCGFAWNRARAIVDAAT
ncbi:hypothetical protein DQ237_04390 [Blastococcus sp. TF02-8]|uniref:hypothetical protein n=1 Tax=Blastococcus sp. TF02-8 TaxID=2250574 RepID=UPI000DEA0424|nr:hypothetical protein [Blastococcus sp. TF02-8]RBY96861.1 hypothetical protein DQ237_04390 [Blastococcus sp. TF02-8]